MFKTICIFAILALAISQDVTGAVDAAANAAGSVTVGEVVANPIGTAEEALGNNNVNITELPTLNSLTVGWGNHSVVVTPQSENPTNDDWLNNGELLNLERVVTDTADGEWTLNWSVEDGNDWALWNNNGDLVIVDWVNGESNVVADLGNQPLLDAEIAAGAEAIVDEAWNSGEDVINTSDLAPQINNLVNQVWNNVNLQGFLSQNSGNSVGAVVGEVVDTVTANPQAAVDTVNGAV